MPLHGIGQSPHDSFFVMYGSTAAPSIFMPFLPIGNSFEPTPRQLRIGASPFSIESATASVVPRLENARRIAAAGVAAFAPSFVIKRYIQPSQLFALMK